MKRSPQGGFFCCIISAECRIMGIAMKGFLFVLLGLLGILQYQLWYGVNNLPRSVQLREQIAIQQAGNAKLIERNQVLREEIIDLRSGTEALEERARNELGMVKKDETFFRVVGGSLKSAN